jgi:hypothetical protein
LKYLAGPRNKSNTNQYLSDNTEIVDNRSLPELAKLAYRVVLMGGSAAQVLNFHKEDG